MSKVSASNSQYVENPPDTLLLYYYYYYYVIPVLTVLTAYEICNAALAAEE